MKKFRPVRYESLWLASTIIPIISHARIEVTGRASTPNLNLLIPKMQVGEASFGPSIRWRFCSSYATEVPRKYVELS